jgi:DNA-binding transcriptional ArsR family regulator
VGEFVKPRDAARELWLRYAGTLPEGIESACAGFFLYGAPSIEDYERRCRHGEARLVDYFRGTAGPVLVGDAARALAVHPNAVYALLSRLCVAGITVPGERVQGKRGWALAEDWELRWGTCRGDFRLNHALPVDVPLLEHDEYVSALEVLRDAWLTVAGEGLIPRDLDDALDLFFRSTPTPEDRERCRGEKDARIVEHLRANPDLCLAVDISEALGLSPKVIRERLNDLRARGLLAPRKKGRHRRGPEKWSVVEAAS